MGYKYYSYAVSVDLEANPVTVHNTESRTKRRDHGVNPNVEVREDEGLYRWE